MEQFQCVQCNELFEKGTGYPKKFGPEHEHCCTEKCWDEFVENGYFD